MKCTLKALQVHFISVTHRCMITAWFLCPEADTLCMTALYMENSEWYLTPLDLNLARIFLQYTLASNKHKARFFPWALTNEESNTQYIIY